MLARRFLISVYRHFKQSPVLREPTKQRSVGREDSLNDYLRKRGFSQSLKYFAPCDNVTVMLRLVEYTVFAYEQEDNNAQAAVYRAFIPLFGNRTTSFMNDDSA